ncbi:MAG: GntR family transcriptional regulator [Sphaerochaeta sp.]|nr:GntR family transcriptional regulator [Sphaerochaeta sp.]
MHITARLAKETAREYALRILKDNIISLDLAPGSMVSENEISSQLGLSRTPIREALIELSRANIVEIYPQKGSRILLIDYALVEESRFLRLVLESAVVKVICEREGTLDISLLEENLKLQEFYLENPNPDKLLELDNQFHCELFNLANKMQCYHWMMDGMTVHFDRVRSMSLNTIKDIKIVNDHKALIAAISERNSQEAVSLMEKHLSRYKIDEQAIREKYPQYFSEV